MTVQLIRRTAKEIAGAFWDDTRTERFRKFWPDQRVYIERNWTQYVEVARACLTDMLARKDVPEYEKQQIYDALTEDRRREQKREGNVVTPALQSPELMLNPDHPGQLEQKLFWKN